MEFNNIPTTLLILLLVRAFWIVAFFGFIQHILLKVIRNERLHDFVKFYNPLLQNVAWVLFAMNVVFDFSKINPVVSLAVLGVMLALGWQSIRDFVQGTVFRFQKGDITGQRLKVKNYSGVVVKMHNTKIELRAKNGEIMQIPYSRIISEVTTKPAATKHLKTGNLVVALPVESNVEEAKSKLKEQLLNIPWVVSSKGVHIELLKPKNGKQQFKVVFSTLNAEYVERVRELLENFSALH